MAGDKRFGNQLHGYNKENVNSYIDIMIDQFNNKLEQKNREISALALKSGEYDADVVNLKGQIGELTEINSQLSSENAQLKEEMIALKEQMQQMQSENSVNDERNKVANTLLLAAETAEKIVSEAQAEAEKILENAVLKSNEDRKTLEDLIEAEKEKLIDIKREMRLAKQSFVDVLKKYESEIDEISSEG